MWSQTEIIDSYNEMNRLGYNNCSKQLELILFFKYNVKAHCTHINTCACIDIGNRDFHGQLLNFKIIVWTNNIWNERIDFFPLKVNQGSILRFKNIHFIGIALSFAWPSNSYPEFARDKWGCRLTCAYAWCDPLSLLVQTQLPG